MDYALEDDVFLCDACAPMRAKMGGGTKSVLLFELLLRWHELGHSQEAMNADFAQRREDLRLAGF